MHYSYVNCNIPLIYKGSRFINELILVLLRLKTNDKLIHVLLRIRVQERANTCTTKFEDS